MDDRFGISVATLRPIADLLSRQGEDPEAFLASLGVTADLAPNTYVRAADVDRALQAIADRRGDPALALALARTAATRPMGLFGHMVWLSGTVGDAIGRAVKRWGLVTQRSTLALREDGRFTVLRSQPVSERERPGRILNEYAFASLALHARGSTHDAFRLSAVSFVHAGDDAPAYREVFGVPVTFGAPFDELAMETALLATPLDTADPDTVAALEAKVAQLTSEAAGARLAERVRQIVLAYPDSEAEPDLVARALGISERTLRRHLEAEGTTLRAISDGVRRSRADELLAAGKSVKEVAFALGFSEASAFSRAYKRWTGKAPRI